MARIALVGPGAIGGTIAAWLAHTGRHEVTLCARRPLEGEWLVETPSGPLRSRPRVLTDPKHATPVDWILVATKAYDVAGAAAWLPGLGASGAPAAILQNGVEHRERFASYLPAERIVPVMIDLPAERVTPTHIRQRGTGKMVLSDDAHGRAFQELFAGTPLVITLTPDLKSAVWRKLCLNSAGVISGLVMQPGGVMRDEAIGDLSREIVRECIDVGRAEGADLDDALAEWVLETYRKAPPDSINSLYGDRLAGRITEIDARNGVIVRLGRKHGIATPCNQMAVALIEAMTRQTS